MIKFLPYDTTIAIAQEHIPVKDKKAYKQRRKYIIISEKNPSKFLLFQIGKM